MTVKKFCVNPFEMNCYVYYDEKSKEGVIIDPGVYSDQEKKELGEFISKEGIDIKLILNTHGHIDHIIGNDWAKKLFKVPLLMHKDDLPIVRKAVKQGEMYGVEFPQPPDPDKYIDETDEVKFGDTVFKIIHTPGHSPGSVCFIDEKEKIIFGGDVLFKNSIGRTDLWMGDIDVLLDSINKKVFIYGDEYKIYPGHMEDTTIGDEKKNNPFLK